MSAIEIAIADYRNALDSLHAPDADQTGIAALRVLLARDAVARGLSAENPPAAETLIALSELDGRLTAAAAAIVASAGRAALSSWRQTLSAPPSAGGQGAGWWWSLDQLAPEAVRRPSVLWAILAGFLLTLSISLAADISRRFLTGGPDFIGVFSTVSQGLLALLAGSAVIQAGRGWIERTLSDLGVPPQRQHLWKTGLALAVLGLILALRLSLPAIGRLYNDRGVQLQAAGLTTSAIESYVRGLNLNPDAAGTRYNLATAYEDILDYDAALTEYQKAIRANPKLYPAHINLARLYNLRKRDYASALGLLDNALKLNPTAADTQYSLYKNRGWAHLGLKLLKLAEDDLRRAVALRPDAAAAHCLLAQTLEAKGQTADALPAWDGCLAYDAPGEGVEADWRAVAQERLTAGPPAAGGGAR